MAKDKDKKVSKLGPFKFFGMDFHDEDSGKDNILGDCLFCGKEKHCFVNQYTGCWDCKVCGRSGDIATFLQPIYDDLLTRTSNNDLIKLAQFRKIPVEQFIKFKVVCYKDIFLFPTYAFNGKINNIYHSQIGRKMQSLPDMHHELWNLPELLDIVRRDETVFINESIFNAIANDWLLRQNDEKGVCISLPGATGFKSDWVAYFGNRKVVSQLDNDGAGEAGTQALHKMLEPVVKKHFVFTWPIDAPPSADINDIVSAFGVGPNQPIDCYKNKYLPRIRPWKEYQEYKKNPTLNLSEQTYQSLKVDPQLPPSGVITTGDMIKQYERIMDLNDDLIKTIKLCLATILSIRVPGNDPAWLFLVGPPGYGKTLILTSFKNSPEFAYYQSSLRRHSLVSGMPSLNGIDPSLLPKLHEKALVLKDYTEVLSKNQEDRNEIFGILRGAFDGSVERDFGNGTVRRYEPLRFSILAGVTNEINNYAQASVGERFIRFKLKTTGIDFDKQQESALRNSLTGEEAKEEIQNAVNVFLSQEWDYSTQNIVKVIPDWFYKKLTPLARLTAWLRTPVVRHEKGINRHEVVYEPENESGNRLSIQFQRIAISMAIIERKRCIDEELFRLVQRIAMDTITNYSTRIAQILYRAGKPITQTEIGDKLGMSNVYNYLEDLILTKVIKKYKEKTEKGTVKSLYEITSECKDLYQKADL